jgi:hypothetical protein
MYTILTGEPEGMRTFGRCGRIWEDNIKMDLGKTGWRIWIKFIWPMITFKLTVTLLT